MGNKFNQILVKVKNLPSAGKALLAGGTGLLLYMLIKPKETQELQAVLQDDAGIVYLPSTDSYYGSNYDDGFGATDDYYTGGGTTGTTGTTGSSSTTDTNTGSSGSSSNYESSLDGLYDRIDAWGNSMFDTFGAATKEEDLKAEAVIIPTTTTSSSSTYDANVALQKAQEADFYATTAAEKAAAAKAGAEARANGATGAGADAVWKSSSSSSNSSSSSSTTSSSSSSSSSSSANAALQKAQADYGAAKTTAEKEAAAAAGQAARANGATDAGADSVWKSL